MTYGIKELTGFIILARGPEVGGCACFKFDEEGCMDVCKAGEGAPTDNPDTDCPFLGFLRDAETVGLGTDS